MSHSARLSPASRRVLRGLVSSVPNHDSYSGRVTVFVPAHPTPAQVSLAHRRAVTVRRLLATQGVDGPLVSRTSVAPAVARTNSGLVALMPPGQAGVNSIGALIVGYRPGTVVSIGGSPVGAGRVAGPLRPRLVVDVALGLDMYRVTISPGVSPAVAARIARELATAPAVRFAEPDSLLLTRH